MAKDNDNEITSWGTEEYDMFMQNLENSSNERINMILNLLESGQAEQACNELETWIALMHDEIIALIGDQDLM